MTAVRVSRHAALAYREATGMWPHEAAGVVQVYKGRGRNRNHLATVYDGEAAGLDTNADSGTDPQPWSTVCERHNHVVCHSTLTLAREWVTHPEQWCDECMAADEAGAQRDAGNI